MKSYHDKDFTEGNNFLSTSLTTPVNNEHIGYVTDKSLCKAFHRYRNKTYRTKFSPSSQKVDIKLQDFYWRFQICIVQKNKTFNSI